MFYLSLSKGAYTSIYKIYKGVIKFVIPVVSVYWHASYMIHPATFNLLCTREGGAVVCWCRETSSIRLISCSIVTTCLMKVTRARPFDFLRRRRTSAERTNNGSWSIDSTSWWSWFWWMSSSPSVSIWSSFVTHAQLLFISTARQWCWRWSKSLCKKLEPLSFDGFILFFALGNIYGSRLPVSRLL